MLLSFIIPVYNCSQYIERCIGSICRIPLDKDEYEIIIVDDSSTDGTSIIAKEFCEKNNLLYHIFLQSKAGPATARNKGLDEAFGNYVWMIDSDDELFNQNHKIIELLRKDKYDMITFGYKEIFQDSDNIVSLYHKDMILDGADFLKHQSGGSFLWNKIFRREIICHNRFIDGIYHIEDMCFNINAIIGMTKVLCLPIIGYAYHRENINSISHSRSMRDRIVANEDSLKVYLSLKTLHDKLNGEAKSVVFDKLNFDVTAHLYTIFCFDNVRMLKRYISIYRYMGLYPLKKNNNFKAELFRLIANHESLLIVAKYLLTKK